MMHRMLPALALVPALVLGACSDSEPLNPIAGESFEEFADRSPAPGADPIAAIAINAGFSQLVDALSYVDSELNTGLVDLFLNGRDQYTVFAPTNEAFYNLYGLLSDVLETEIDQITDLPASVVLSVLQYHVVEGRRAANSVLPRQGERTMKPLLGEYFWVRADGTIRDGLTGLRADAAIETANISASNGIIHVINEVIVPPSVVAAITN